MVPGAVAAVAGSGGAAFCFLNNSFTAQSCSIHTTAQLLYWGAVLLPGILTVKDAPETTILQPFMIKQFWQLVSCVSFFYYTEFTDKNKLPKNEFL